MSFSSDLLAFYNSIVETNGDALLYRSTVLEVLSKDPAFQANASRLSGLNAEHRTLVLLRALSAQKTELSPRLIDAELVVTFPGPNKITARHTAQTVRQMVESASREIIVAGFAITDAGQLLPQLADAARKGVRIILLCSHWKSREGIDTAQLVATKWPPGVVPPKVYQYLPDGEHAGMHIKCLLVDGADLLITSANFTYPGMNTNFEMGTRLNGHVAAAARTVFDEFLRCGRFTEIPWSDREAVPEGNGVQGNLAPDE